MGETDGPIEFGRMSRVQRTQRAVSDLLYRIDAAEARTVSRINKRIARSRPWKNASSLAHRVSDSNFGRSVAHTRHMVSDAGGRFVDKLEENSYKTNAGGILSTAEMGFLYVYGFLVANKVIDESLAGLAIYCAGDFTVRALTGYGLSEEIGRPVVNLARKTGRATRRGIEYIGDKALRKVGSTFYKINR